MYGVFFIATDKNGVYSTYISWRNGGRLKSSELIRKLEERGWQLVRIKGSHHTFKHPTSPDLITVPHPTKDIEKWNAKTDSKEGADLSLNTAPFGANMGLVMHYPAFIEIDQDGSASGWFPDVPGCIFAGTTFDDAFIDALSAIDAHFEAMVEAGNEIPVAKTMQYHINHNAGEFVGGQWTLIHIDMDKFDGKAERINITLPHRLLYQIDRIVKQNPEYSSRSGFLAAAARKELSYR